MNRTILVLLLAACLTGCGKAPGKLEVGAHDVVMVERERYIHSNIRHPNSFIRIDQECIVQPGGRLKVVQILDTHVNMIYRLPRGGLPPDPRYCRDREPVSGRHLELHHFGSIQRRS